MSAPRATEIEIEMQMPFLPDAKRSEIDEALGRREDLQTVRGEINSLIRKKPKSSDNKSIRVLERGQKRKKCMKGKAVPIAITNTVGAALSGASLTILRGILSDSIKANNLTRDDLTRNFHSDCTNATIPIDNYCSMSGATLKNMTDTTTPYPELCFSLIHHICNLLWETLSEQKEIDKWTTILLTITILLISQLPLVIWRCVEIKCQESEKQALANALPNIANEHQVPLLTYFQPDAVPASFIIRYPELKNQESEMIEALTLALPTLLEPLVRIILQYSDWGMERQRLMEAPMYASILAAGREEKKSEVLFHPTLVSDHNRGTPIGRFFTKLHGQKSGSVDNVIGNIVEYAGFRKRT